MTVLLYFLRISDLHIPPELMTLKPKMVSFDN